ncbi:MAG: hypothetical protein ABI651_13315 [Verrucomicrobiota bacterium]
MSNEKPKKTYKPRTRSPAYPAIDLEEALLKAANVWEKANRHAVPIDIIGTYWGYDEKSSAGISAASALKKYGLLIEEGSKVTRTMKLSDLGIKLIYNPDPETEDYKTAIVQAALNPSIHAELWKKYDGDLPDDSVIKRYLVVDRKFNEVYVDACMSNFRKSIAFAKLVDSSIVNQEIDTQLDMAPSAQASKPQTPTSLLRAQVPPATKPAQTTSSSEELSLPLENGKVIRIPKMTEDDYNLMIETLKLWKRRIVISANGRFEGK